MKKLSAVLIICIMMIATLSTSFVAKADGYEITGLEDLNGLRAGALAGTPHRSIIEGFATDSEVLEFQNLTDEILALKEGKIDFIVNTTIMYKFMVEQNPEFGYLDEELYNFDVGAIFPMTDAGARLRDEYSEFIAEIKEDGRLAEIEAYWMETGDKENLDIPKTGENGVISMVTCSSHKPFSYILNGENAGFDIAIAVEFAKEKGYGLAISDADFAGTLSGISTGKFDMAAGQISWTAERAEKVYYSDFYYKQILVPILKSSDIAGASASATGGEKLEYNSIKELEEAKIFGTATGTITVDYTKERFPDAQTREYSLLTDLVLALESGKIDAFMWDEPIVDRVVADNPHIGKVPELYLEEDYYFIFAKDKTDLRDEFNEWLRAKRSEGYIDKKKDYWINEPEENIKPVDYKSLTGEKGTISAYVYVDTRPCTYLIDNEYSGYTMDIFTDFARDAGYALKLENVDNGTSVAGLTVGKADVSLGFISKTPEREKALLYSDPVYSGGLAFVVRTVGGEAVAEDSVKGFFDGIKESFKRSFIDENRYKLIINGLGVTLLITILGFVLANIFGAVSCYMAMSKSKVLKGIAGFYSYIMQGTPMVVILMILYYVIFGNSQISGIVVAIIGFGLAIGAYLSQTFEGAIRGVDGGQWEAALAMGFTKFETFTGIIAPQAGRAMLVGYFSQLISLMKGTAIVGYIAVADLTKAGDMIRSGTFEAFLPLILVSLIYLGITFVFLSVLKMMKKRLEYN